ncbi:MAG: chitobiase/beta-hexosaminidase C-terminal domain-containing protein [Fibrobacteria bacterium]|nr:chitobiase/beta-hexosaminidase C-terminal domain-containing protein [Fibrobacteria bacterium]
MINNKFKLHWFIAAFIPLCIIALIACDMFNSGSKEKTYTISLNPEGIDTTAYDSITFSGTSSDNDTLSIFTWHKGESFPGVLYPPDILGAEFDLIITGWKQDERTKSIISTIDLERPDAPRVFNAPIIITLSVNDNTMGNVAVSQTKGNLNPGDTVKITAIPTEGHKFTGWKGHNSPDSIMTIILTGDTSVMAMFAPLNKYQINFMNPNGRVNLTPPDSFFLLNSKVNATPIPDSGYVFDKWIFGDSTLTNIPLEITVTRDTSITCVFIKKVPVVTSVQFSDSVNFQEMGRVEVSPSNMNLEKGDTITITAFANQGYKFTGWMGHISSDSIITIVLTGDSTVIALFAPIDKFLISFNNPNGNVSVTPSDSFYALNSQLTAVATPDTGYEFNSWKIGIDTYNTDTLRLTVTGDSIITCLFTRINLPISLTASPLAGGLPTIDSGLVQWNVSKTIYAKPSTGYNFVGWSQIASPGIATFSDNLSDTTQVSISIDSVAIKASYELKTFTLHVTHDENSYDTVVDYGKPVVITTTIPDSKFFSHWKTDSGFVEFGDSSLTSTSVTLKNGDANISAVYTTKPTLSNVRFSHESSRFQSAFNLTLSITPDTIGTKIYYTLDGHSPTEASLLYESPILISDTLTVKARAFNAPDYLPSLVSSNSFIKNEGPKLSITEPTLTSDSAISTTENIFVRGTADDDSLVKLVTATINGNPQIVNEDVWSFTSTLVPWQWNTVIVKVEDDFDITTSDTFYVYYSKTITTPAAPTVDSVLGNAIYISWETLIQGENYNVYRSESGGAYSRVETTSQTTFADTGLTASTGYEYKIMRYYKAPGSFNRTDSSVQSTALVTRTITAFNKAITFGYSNMEGHKVLVTDNNEYIIAGWAEIGGDAECFMAKVDSLGNEVWKKHYGGRGEYCYDAIETNDGYYVLVGVNYNSPRNGPYLIKTELNGDTVLTSIFGHGQSGYSYEGYAISEYETGNYVIAGYSQYFPIPGATIVETSMLFLFNNDSFLARKDTASGITQRAVISLSDGTHITCGHSDEYAVISKFDFVNKPDSWEAYWSNTFGIPNHKTAFSLVLNGDDTYSLTGSSTSEDVYLATLSSDGSSILWSKNYGGSGNDTGFSVQAVPNSGYIIAGATNSFGSGGKDAYLIRTDDSGNEVWSKSFGGTVDDEARSIKNTSDGGFIMLGSTKSAGVTSAFYLIKTDKNGHAPSFQ